MEEYLRLVLEQIRYKKIHTSIQQELQDHIRSQVNENIKLGMEPKQALEEAILEMGDPIEVGVSLDRIHRPKMEWKLLLMMALITIVSILVHISIGTDYIVDSPVNYTNGFGYICKIIEYEFVGFIAMFIVYRLDYSILAKHAKKLAGVLLLISFLTVYIFGTTAGGVRNYLYVCGHSIEISSLVLLYIPIYGAILYQQRESGIRGVIKSILWMIAPVWILCSMPKVPQAFVCFLMMSLMLTIAVKRGWFQISACKFIWGYWGTLFVVAFAAIISIINGFGGDIYQAERIRSRFSSAYDNANYTVNCISDLIQNSKWVGDSGKDIAHVLPEFHTDYILVFICVHFGKLAMIGTCALLIALIYLVFRIAFRQKNQLGFIVGIGCGMVFLVSTLFYIAEMMQILPLTACSLFFFSFGGSQVIIGDLLIGTALSIYRYKNLLPVNPKVAEHFPYEVKIVKTNREEII